MVVKIVLMIIMTIMMIIMTIMMIIMTTIHLTMLTHSPFLPPLRSSRPFRPSILAFILYIIIHSTHATTVDITSSELISACTSIKVEYKEIRQHLCIMAHDACVTRVLNDGHLIWEASGKEQCTYYTVYRYYGKDHLGYLKLNAQNVNGGRETKGSPGDSPEHYDGQNAQNEHNVHNDHSGDHHDHSGDHRLTHSTETQPGYIYYRINGVEWTEIPAQEYVKLFSRMQRERIMDIRSPDEEILETKEYSPFGAPAFIHRVRGDYRLFRVQDGVNAIWETRSGDSTCDSVIVHGASGDAILVHIFVQNGMDYDVMYYGMDDGRWRELSKTEFYEMVSRVNDRRE